MRRQGFENLRLTGTVEGSRARAKTMNEISGLCLQMHENTKVSQKTGHHTLVHNFAKC